MNKRGGVRILALIFMTMLLFMLVSCQVAETETYDDAVFVTTKEYTLTKDALSTNENDIVMGITDSMLTAVLVDDEIPTDENIISIIGANFFDLSDEDGTFKAGGIYEDDIKKMVGDSTDVVKITLTGLQVKKLAEQTLISFFSYSDSSKISNLVFHFSGVGFVYDDSKSAGNRIITYNLLNESVFDINNEFTVLVPDSMLLDDDFRNVVGVKSEFVFDTEYVGNLYDMVVDNLGTYGLSTGNYRFVNESVLNTPTVVVTVLMIVLGVALVVIVGVFFYMKKKQKKYRNSKSKNERIDV